MIYPPLFGHSVGFDRMQQLMNTENKWDSNAQAYPIGWREPQDVTFLHRGIAGKAFERRFEIP